MKTIDPETLQKMEDIQNKEDVRIFRLTLLEENQVKILKKIEEMEERLVKSYDYKINDHEKRLTLIEKEVEDIEKLRWLVIGETVTLIGGIILLIASHII